MIEVGCLTLPPHVEGLKREQNNLRDEIKEASKDKRRKLLLGYAEKCEALGRWYRQEGYKIAAQCEFGYAAGARRNAALNCDVLMGWEPILKDSPRK